jgi:hypothetical protein
MINLIAMKYPSTVNDEWWFLIYKIISFYVNTITIPPCEYDCKVEIKKISRSRSKRRWGMLFNTITRVKSYQFLHKTSIFLIKLDLFNFIKKDKEEWFFFKKNTREIFSKKKSFFSSITGVAWLSSVRAVRN